MIIVRYEAVRGKHLLPERYRWMGREEADLCCGSGTKKARLRQNLCQAGDFQQLSSEKQAYIRAGDLLKPRLCLVVESSTTWFDGIFTGLCNNFIKE